MTKAFILGVCACLVLIAGCSLFTLEGRVEKRYQEKLSVWKEANPGKLPTPEEDKALREAATAEVVEERAQAAKDAATGVGALASGNWIAGGLLLLGAGLTFVGLKRGAAKEEPKNG